MFFPILNVVLSMCCAAFHNVAGKYLTLGLVRPTMPASVGTMVSIAARHVNHLVICVSLRS